MREPVIDDDDPLAPGCVRIDKEAASQQRDAERVEIAAGSPCWRDESALRGDRLSARIAADGSTISDAQREVASSADRHDASNRARRVDRSLIERFHLLWRAVTTDRERHG